VNRSHSRRCAIDPLAFTCDAGGFDITMQVARLRFHLHTRTVPENSNRSCARSIGAALFKTNLGSVSEPRALWPNIEGIGAASLIYFR